MAGIKKPAVTMEDLRNAECDLYKAVMGRADQLAKKRKIDLEGWEALYRIFADDHHWLPSQVRSLTLQEIDALLPAR